MKLHHALALVLALPLLAASAQEQKPAPLQKPIPAAGLASTRVADKQIVAAEKPSYPLTTCVVKGEKLGEGAVDRVVGGHLVRLCCMECIATVEKDPARYRKKVEAAVVSEQKPSYPLTTCVVTGEVLAFDSIDHVHGTRLVRLKDMEAVASFEKRHVEMFAKLDKALIEAQLKNYGVAVCPVTREPLDNNAVNHLYGTKLVRLCCKGCIKGFEAAPEKYLAELAKLK